MASDVTNIQEDTVLPDKMHDNTDAQPGSPTTLLENFISEPVLIVESPDGRIDRPWIHAVINDTDRIMAKPANDGSVVVELAEGHFPHGLTAGLTTNRDSEDHEDDSDSQISAEVSIFSSLTDSSIPRNPFEDASVALVRFLATEDSLKELCVAAAAGTGVTAEVFQLQYSQMLLQYGCDLRSEAENHVQKQAARFLRKRACDAARAIRRHFFDKGESLLHELLRLPQKEAVVVDEYLSGIDQSECAGSEDSASDAGNETLPELESLKDFLLNSRALEALRISLQVFLIPDVPEVLTTEDDAEENANAAASAAAVTPESAEGRFQSGLLYLARTRSFPVSLLSFFDYLTALFWRYYILCLTYMFSLISRDNWERYSRDQSSFKMIYLYDGNGTAQESIVRLDTGSDLNVISAKKLRKLGDVKIDKEDHGVKMRSVDGHTYQPRCSLELKWSLRKNTRIHKERFFVVDDCPEELLFSDPYIGRLGIIKHDWEQAASVTLNVFDKKYVETEDDKEAKKRAREEKLALEARKRAQQHALETPLASPAGTPASTSTPSSGS